MTTSTTQQHKQKLNLISAIKQKLKKRDWKWNSKSSTSLHQTICYKFLICHRHIRIVESLSPHFSTNQARLHFPHLTQYITI